MQKPVEKRTITRIFICTLLFPLYHIADFSRPPQADILERSEARDKRRGGFSLQFMLPVSLTHATSKFSPHAAGEFTLRRWY